MTTDIERVIRTILKDIDTNLCGIGEINPNGITNMLIFLDNKNSNITQGRSLSYSPPIYLCSIGYENDCVIVKPYDSWKRELEAATFQALEPQERLGIGATYVNYPKNYDKNTKCFSFNITDPSSIDELEVCIKNLLSARMTEEGIMLDLLKMFGMKK